MKIIIAKTIGFCYGVKKAVELAENSVNHYPPPIYTIGPLIHNQIEIDRLKKTGINPTTDIDNIKKGTLIIRTHGLPKETISELKSKKLTLLDATCPFVKRIQNLVSKLSNEGYFIIIVGEKEHPEIQAVLSYVNGVNVAVINDEKEINNLINNNTPEKNLPIAVVGQTTLELAKFNRIVDILIKQFPQLKICNTICNASIERQKETTNLAKSVDLMIIIGGKNSANTRHLVEVCKKYVCTYLIESEKDINSKLLKYITNNNINTIGINAGASTPSWLIEKIVSKLKNKFKNTNTLTTKNKFSKLWVNIEK